VSSGPGVAADFAPKGCDADHCAIAFGLTVVELVALLWLKLVVLEALDSANFGLQKGDELFFFYPDYYIRQYI
jgi:hypothetical protein